MKHDATLTVGIDLGDRYSQVCVLDENGMVVEEGRVATTESALRRKFGSLGQARVALETGTHSPWVSRLLKDLGHEVLVANAAKLRAIYQSDKKCDELDAQMLAKIARFDPALLSPIQPRGSKTQAGLALVRARAAAVSVRAKLIGQIRGLCKSLGTRLPSGSTATFHQKVRDYVPEELKPAVFPMLEALAKLSEAIADYDRQMAAAVKRNPEIANLTTAYSIGETTALTYALIIEDPKRFRDSRAVGSYLGLRPRRDQSSTVDKELSITKAGDPYLRLLLVECAQHLLGRFGRDCALRRWGLALAARGKGRAKRRAIVAVARKLAVLLHKMWLTGEPFKPFPDGQPSALAA